MFITVYFSKKRNEFLVTETLLDFLHSGTLEPSDLSLKTFSSKQTLTYETKILIKITNTKYTFVIQKHIWQSWNRSIFDIKPILTIPTRKCKVNVCFKKILLKFIINQICLEVLAMLKHGWGTVKLVKVALAELIWDLRKRWLFVLLQNQMVICVYLSIKRSEFLEIETLLDFLPSGSLETLDLSL